MSGFSSLFRILALALALMPLRGLALPPADACEWAAQQAAAEIGVPADILGALALTETGRRLDGIVRPWAWSANAEGEGAWFDDPASAVAFAEDRVTRGRTNIDIGCFQLNYRWHGAHFPSVARMFDPLENARYAPVSCASFMTRWAIGGWRRGRSTPAPLPMRSATWPASIRCTGCCASVGLQA